MNGLRVSLFLLTAIACVHCKSAASSSSGTDDKAGVDASAAGTVQVQAAPDTPVTVDAPPVNAVATATIAPPAPRVETRPPAPSAHHYWIPGNWRWVNGRYEWVGGHWDTVRNGHTYVAGHWVHHNGHYYYVEGAWR